MAVDPATDERARQVAHHERQHQLHHDGLNGVPGIDPLPLHIDHQPHQHRREEDAEDAGGRGAAHRRRHIAPRHGGEGDGRLHGGGQGAQIQETEIDGRAQPLGHQGREQQPQQREEQEGARHHHQVQPPVAEARQQVLARQLGTMHEEQERHRQLGQQTEPDGHLPLAGEEGGQGHHGNQHRGKRIQTHGESPEKARPAREGTTGHGEGVIRRRPRIRRDKLTPNTLWCKVERQPHLFHFVKR